MRIFTAAKTSLVFFRIEAKVSVVDFDNLAELSLTGMMFVSCSFEFIISDIKVLLKFQNTLAKTKSFQYSIRTNRGIRTSFSVSFLIFSCCYILKYLFIKINKDFSSEIRGGSKLEIRLQQSSVIKPPTN